MPSLEEIVGKGRGDLFPEDLVREKQKGSDLTSIFKPPTEKTPAPVAAENSLQASRRKAAERAAKRAAISAKRRGETSEPTVGSVFGGLIPTQDSALKAEQASFEQRLRDQAAIPDEQDIRDKTTARFQAEIDALERVYQDRQRVAATEGRGRLGVSGAIQNIRGLLGSDFGAAQTQGVTDQNTNIRDAITNEKQQKIANLMRAANGQAQKEIDSKVAASRQGAEALLTFITGQAERKTKRVSGTVQNMLDNEVEMDEDTLEELSATLGVSVEVLQAEINRAESTREKEKLAEREAGINIGGELRDKFTGKVLGPAKATEAEEIIKVGNALVQGGEVIYQGQEDSQIIGSAARGYFEKDPKTGDWNRIGGGGGGLSTGNNTSENTITNNFDWAQNFLELNPDSTDLELEVELRKQSQKGGQAKGLTDSDIAKLIESRNVEKESQYDLEALATQLQEGSSRREAIKELDNYDITDIEKNVVLQKIQDDRTRLQKILPFGK